MGLNAFIPFPYDRIIHAAIDGWIHIHFQMEEEGSIATDITNVTIRCGPWYYLKRMTQPLKLALPRNLACIMSLQFPDAVVQNRTTIDLREKVTITSDEGVEEYEAFVAFEGQQLRSMSNTAYGLTRTK
ncbi:hypothetical protein F5Y19DRAFT_491350 [Xylariaceae sp. FL1651]|nr:hypothetical protein F5Y19DRAFT_491350 [Xylariaceae sp. FL1651]